VKRQILVDRSRACRGFGAEAHLSDNGRRRDPASLRIKASLALTHRAPAPAPSAYRVTTKVPPVTVEC
jgi:hypothetical protein